MSVAENVAVSKRNNEINELNEINDINLKKVGRS